MSYTFRETQSILTKINFYLYRLKEGQKSYRIKSDNINTAINSIAMHERCPKDEIELVAIPGSSVHLSKQKLFDRYMDRKQEKVYMVNRRRVTVLEYFPTTVKVKFNSDGKIINISRRLLISFPKKNESTRTKNSKKKNS